MKVNMTIALIRTNCHSSYKISPGLFILVPSAIIFISSNINEQSHGENEVRLESLREGQSFQKESPRRAPGSSLYL
jgi:hypothetical protein